LKELSWSERVNMLSINPDAAVRDDIARMAAELSEAKFTSINTGNATSRGAGGNIVESDMIIEEFIQLMCNSSPLAWCSGYGMDHASDWEKRAVVLIKRATEYLKVKKQLSIAKANCAESVPMATVAAEPE
jgi:hypothetical protein